MRNRAVEFTTRRSDDCVPTDRSIDRPSVRNSDTESEMLSLAMHHSHSSITCVKLSDCCCSCFPSSMGRASECDFDWRIQWRRVTNGVLRDCHVRAITAGLLLIVFEQKTLNLASIADARCQINSEKSKCSSGYSTYMYKNQ